MALAIFLSHSHRDQAVAEALAVLIGDLFGDKVSIAYSSDQKAGGGIPPGAQWLPWILDHITAADRTFALFTPNSMHRPWVLWESGAAAGVALGAQKEIPVVPITFGLKDDDIPSPFSSAQIIRGDSKESGGIKRLLQDLNTSLGEPLTDTAFSLTVTGSLPKFLAAIDAAVKSTSPAESVLASIPSLFSATNLAGRWATTYSFSSGEAVRHHADISEQRIEKRRLRRGVRFAPIGYRRGPTVSSTGKELVVGATWHGDSLPLRSGSARNQAVISRLTRGARLPATHAPAANLAERSAPRRQASPPSLRRSVRRRTGVR